MAVSDLDSGLCPKHAAGHQNDLDQADLAASLIGDTQEFRDALTINHSLGELYKLQARNKISPRRAAVMAYTANLLLRTLPAIALDAKPKEPKVDDQIEFDYSDWPEPSDGSGIRGPACHRRAVLYAREQAQAHNARRETSSDKNVEGSHPQGQNENIGSGSV